MSSLDLFDGITLQDASTVGSLSMLDRLGLALRDQFGDVVRPAEKLGLTKQELLAVHYNLRFSLRPVQQPPEFYKTFFFLGGRGSGKTHAGSAAVITEAMQDKEARITIVGPTYSDIEENQILGPSGILTLAPPWFTPKFLKAKHKLIFPNGVEAKFVPACDPDKFRGKGCSFLWADEIVAWKKDEVAVFNECLTILRMQTKRMRARNLQPRLFITTTPAPTRLFKEILNQKDGMVLARSTTFDNEVNLPADYVRQKRALANTTEGRREFLGELVFNTDANIFSRVDWNRFRIHPDQRPERYDRIYISVDPATGEKSTNDYHGIVVVGIRQEDDQLDHSYVLADLSLRSPNPSVWAKKAVDAYRGWEPYADKVFIHAETNTGGSMVKEMIRQVDPSVRVKSIRANNSKAERASPVSSLAEAGLVHLCGKLDGLERQLNAFTGAHGHRDDRVDALCWPIYRFVAKKRKNAGALGAEDDDSEQNAPDPD